MGKKVKEGMETVKSSIQLADDLSKSGQEKLEKVTKMKTVDKV